jgi:hypothetical protein
MFEITLLVGPILCLLLHMDVVLYALYLYNLCISLFKKS